MLQQKSYLFSTTTTPTNFNENNVVIRVYLRAFSFFAPFIGDHVEVLIVGQPAGRLRLPFYRRIAVGGHAFLYNFKNFVFFENLKK